jgi:hypothetical protein
MRKLSIVRQEYLERLVAVFRHTITVYDLKLSYLNGQAAHLVWYDAVTAVMVGSMETASGMWDIEQVNDVACHQHCLSETR